jgi:glycosyltransferase involved in cell wall biosynthesis
VSNHFRKHGTEAPRLVVAIGGNRHEWRDTLVESCDRPRLPLPYALGGANIKAGFRMSAVDLASAVPTAQQTDVEPFDAVYAAHELDGAISAADLTLLWGWHGVEAVLRRSLRRRSRRPTLCSYVWNAEHGATLRRRAQFAIMRKAAQWANGLVLMTAEQAAAARQSMPDTVPVIQLRVGVDTRFYRHAGSVSNLNDRESVLLERACKDPFIVLPGDELRMNDDALAVVENSDFNLVRIAQYRDKSRSDEFQAEVHRRGLGNRVFVLERISYVALRLLLQKAVAYAGLVDATWQPAGWTVVCESLASGLPAVLYEGLVSRELRYLGADPSIVQAVPMRDVGAFAAALETAASRRAEVSVCATEFAVRKLDLEDTGREFAASLVRLANVA